MSDSIDVPFYVTLEPRWNAYVSSLTGERSLEKVVATAITQKRPDRLQRGGTVVAKLTIRIPKAAFYPLRPEAVIEIPESMVAAVPIEVTATEPDMDGRDA